MCPLRVCLAASWKLAGVESALRLPWPWIVAIPGASLEVPTACGYGEEVNFRLKSLPLLQFGPSFSFPRRALVTKHSTPDPGGRRKDPIRREVGCLGVMCIPFSSAGSSNPGFGFPQPPPNTGFSGPPSWFDRVCTPEALSNGKPDGQEHCALAIRYGQISGKQAYQRELHHPGVHIPVCGNSTRPTPLPCKATRPR